MKRYKDIVTSTILIGLIIGAIHYHKAGAIESRHVLSVMAAYAATMSLYVWLKYRRHKR